MYLTKYVCANINSLYFASMKGQRPKRVFYFQIDEDLFEKIIKQKRPKRVLCSVDQKKKTRIFDFFFEGQDFFTKKKGSGFF